MSVVAAEYRATVRDALSAHPEWWLIVLGLMSWLAVIQHGLSTPKHLHHGPGPATAMLDWQLMVVAMMLPVMVYQSRAVAVRSFVERRHAAIAAFAVCYVLPWTALGAVAVAARLTPLAGSPWLVPGLCAIAAIWAGLPVRERAMVMVYGHGPVVAPDGWPHLRDCGVSGLVVGTWCVVSCWPLMLACALSNHNLLLISAGGAIALIERLSFRPPTRLVVVVCAALAMFLYVSSFAWSSALPFRN